MASNPSLSQRVLSRPNAFRNSFMDGEARDLVASSRSSLTGVQGVLKALRSMGGERDLDDGDDDNDDTMGWIMGGRMSGFLFSLSLSQEEPVPRWRFRCVDQQRMPRQRCVCAAPKKPVAK